MRVRAEDSSVSVLAWVLGIELRLSTLQCVPLPTEPVKNHRIKHMFTELKCMLEKKKQEKLLS